MAIIKDYIDPTVCPICGATDNEAYECDNDNSELWYSYRCRECSARWDEVYDFAPKFIEVF